MPRLKISGITNVEDAKWAAILGVEYLSVVMQEDSEKKISLTRAELIRDMLPSYTSFIVEIGPATEVMSHTVRKLKPGYVQFSSGDLDPEEAVKTMSESLEDLLIMECPFGQEIPFEDSEAVTLYQIELDELPPKEILESIKEKYNMDKTIIHGDWPLADIKKACSILQPFAWSIKGIIEKNPRKINYSVMKEYIREIALW